jgi:hypothetical protein
MRDPVNNQHKIETGQNCVSALCGTKLYGDDYVYDV